MQASTAPPSSQIPSWLSRFVLIAKVWQKLKLSSSFLLYSWVLAIHNDFQCKFIRLCGPSGVRKESVIFTVRRGWAIHTRTPSLDISGFEQICINGRESQIVWIIFGSKDSKEALPNRPTIYSIWTERDSWIGMFLYRDLHWIRPITGSTKSSMVLTPIPCGKLVLHTLTQTRRLAKRALQSRSKSKSSVLAVKQCVTNICSVSESQQIDCKTGSDFDRWPALGNPGFAQELCLCWAFAATLSAGPQLLELQDTFQCRAT